MKAITNHEAFQLLSKNAGTHESLYNKAVQIDKFYAQTLTKTLIVQVFSGWRLSGEQLYGSEKMQISFPDIEPTGIYLDRQRKADDKADDKAEWIPYFPKTLNDFISLCAAKDFPLFFRDSVKEIIFL